MDALGATTLIFRNVRFPLAGTKIGALKNEHEICKLLMVGLKPNNEDAIVIRSDGTCDTRDEFAAKNAAGLPTIKSH